MQTDPLNAAASGTFTIGGDLPVHRLGFGAMRLTGNGVWGPPADADEAKAVLRRVVELGINFIDTAESYGPHVSEQLIGETLSPYAKGLVIATKGGLDRTGPNQWPVDCRPERLREELEGSLERLRLDRIDLYQLHRIDPKVPAETQFETLVKFRDEGKIRHIGLSEVTVEDIQKAEQFFPVATVQNRYNIADREWEPVLDYCTKHSIGFIPWFPLATGKLAGKGSKLSAIAEKHHAAPSQIALQWLLQHSPVMLPIPGTSKVSHLEENVAAVGLEIDPKELEGI